MVTTDAMVAATASGVDGWGVRSRTRGPTSSAVARSTSAALTPVPPTSMPSATPDRRAAGDRDERVSARVCVGVDPGRTAGQLGLPAFDARRSCTAGYDGLYPCHASDGTHGSIGSPAETSRHASRRVIRRILVGLGIVACLTVLGLAASRTSCRPSETGLLALTQVFAPYLFLVLLVFLPLCLLRGAPARLAAASDAGCAPSSSSSGSCPARWRCHGPPTRARSRCPCTTWNLELGLAEPGVVVETIRAMPAGLVGLEELTQRHADAIAADPAISAPVPLPGAPAAGRLHGPWAAQLVAHRGGLDVRLTTRRSCPRASRLEDGRPLAVVVAHPLPGSVRSRAVRAARPTTPRHGTRPSASVRRIIDPILAAGPRSCCSVTSTSWTGRSATASCRRASPTPSMRSAWGLA